MPLREQDKHFLWSLVAAIGVIFVWKGLWEGAYVLADAYFPYLSDPFVFLFIGLAMLTLSGLIFREFDPLGSIDKSVSKILNSIIEKANPEEYHIVYHDKIRKKDVMINADKILRLERGALVVRHHQKKEQFIPFHRITAAQHQGQVIWRL